MRVGLTSGVIAIAIAWLVPPAGANGPSSAKAAEAMVVCESADRLAAADKAKKIQRLEEGIVLAEAAIAADEQDARAHLALFCNIGRKLDLAGLSWRVFGEVRRMQKEIDRAQELAPDDPDILVAKGELLRRMPGPLGGNKEQGRALLLHAVAIRPDHLAGRLYLARAMADDREPGARASVQEALAAAKKAGAVREQSEAQELLASLRD
jgi:cytochrome c-type biogenesis protein CcmH/NrfG